MTQECFSEKQKAVELWQMLLKTLCRLRQSVRPIFHAHGLTGPQWRVFRLVGEAGPEGLSLGRISDELRVTPGNITGIVDKLEEAGLLQRTPHPQDGRATLVKHTEHGNYVFQQIKPALDERVAELLSCLTPQEKQMMLQALQKMLDYVEAHYPGESCESN